MGKKFAILLFFVSGCWPLSLAASHRHFCYLPFLQLLMQIYAKRFASSFMSGHAATEKRVHFLPTFQFRSPWCLYRRLLPTYSFRHFTLKTPSHISHKKLFSNIHINIFLYISHSLFSYIHICVYIYIYMYISVGIFILVNIDIY